jgi:hypothetical protein
MLWRCFDDFALLSVCYTPELCVGCFERYRAFYLMSTDLSQEVCIADCPEKIVDQQFIPNLPDTVDVTFH